MRSGFGPRSALLLLGHWEGRVEWQQRTRRGMRTRERQSQSVISPLCCTNTASIYTRERENIEHKLCTHLHWHALASTLNTLITKPQSCAFPDFPICVWLPQVVPTRELSVIGSCWAAFILLNHFLSVSFLLGETSLVWTCGQAQTHSGIPRRWAVSDPWPGTWVVLQRSVPKPNELPV